MKTIKRILIQLVLLIGTFKSNAQNPYLVKDINPNSAWSSPRNLTKVNQTVFFEAITNLGWGLWKSDGTTAGTVLLKSFGPDNELYNLADMNGVLYFRANDGTNGFELWKSDGTVAGTVMVKDINPGSASSYPSDFIYFNNQIFFVAGDNTNGPAIWTTDGTTAGTVIFKDLTPGTSTGGGAFSLTIMGNNFYFWGNPVAQTSRELWKSDGTNSGTVLVKAFSGFTTPSIKVSNGRLFFAYGGGAAGYMGVWVSDGTTAGTTLLKQLDVAIATGVLEDRMADVNGTLFFVGDDGIKGKELWKTDGTITGTTMVKDIRTGIVSSSPQTLTAYKGLLYFVAIDDNSTTELWKSNGTEAGTVLIEAPYSGSTHPTSLHVYNNTLFFNASQWTGNAGIELWKSDGSTTSMIYDIYVGSNHSSTAYHVGVNNKLFFSAQDAVHGIELWALDVANTGGVLQSALDKKIKLYPNPVLENIYFDIDQYKGSYSEFEIFNIQGTIVKHDKIVGNRIGVAELTPGLYVIRLSDSAGNASSGRFIKL